MKSSWKSLASAALGFGALAWAQCPNQVALYNPNLRTQTQNNTWFIIPVNSTAVQSAIDSSYGKGNVVLGSVPTSDTSLFPSGFPAGYHPILVSAGFGDDIRMAAFQIDGPLLSGQLYAPYVRKPSSAAGTVLSAELSGYLAGENNNAVAGLVPATVSTVVEGFSTRLGQFLPDAAAYQSNGGNLLSANVGWDVLPNPISGPGVYIEAWDFQFVTATKYKKYTAKLFKAVLNQPAILSSVNAVVGLCQRNQLYFNNATGTMIPRWGNVTIGAAADGAGPQLKGTLQKASPDGSGFYGNAEGFSACGQMVGFNPESCDDAAQNVDPSAL